MRKRRTGGPSGRTRKHDVKLVPDGALVTAQADPRRVGPCGSAAQQRGAWSTPAKSAPPEAPAPGPGGGENMDYPERQPAG